MTKEFIPYKQALALKELGFDEPCFMFYEQGTSSKYLQKGIDDDYWGDYSEPRDWNSIPNKPWKPFCQCISAPLYQQAFRWFREKYNIQGYIYSSTVRGNKEGTKQFTGYIWNINGIDMPFISTDIKNELYDIYEEAELKCLKKLIEIVKNK